jgi:hypothetical protein
MTVREILKMGDPRLLRIAPPVREFGTPELRALVADMFETMRSVNGAGLAAPQIGVDLQLVIFGFQHNARYPDAPAVPETVLLNPTIEAARQRRGGGLGGVPLGAGHARRGAALRPHPLPRLRPRRLADRARGRRLPRPGRPARVRPPRRQALPDADPRFQPLRLHERAFPRPRPAAED